MLIWESSDSDIWYGHCYEQKPSYDMSYVGVAKYIKDDDDLSAYAVGACRSCGNLSLFLFKEMLYEELCIKENYIQNINRHIDAPRIITAPMINERMFTVIPKPTILIESAQGWPEEVINNMLSAKELMVKNNPRYASVILSACRTALETAIKNITDDQGKAIDFSNNINLKNKIKSLREQNLITRELYEWSNHIRLAGNKAVHEGEAHIEDANECFEFVHLFCHILFTLPALIEQNKLINSDKSTE
ncbi:hypothetical protein CKC_04025 [Candidatus Liberibacter solanacearum CLso-ZC1]|uniref:DUF4145 domain-containing protein n=1 Tax=Liberibacter solanacearum (strain CLso-ZC1) TaxID=658172 RepID=E4UB75_LIBSC|nr:DUF4145 domain-containing protein [Candidatus Liberibacter solanacearum]ADR52554.1 hypothetical protein CKC_04025 [Candidatus Liberibacter solanacearum CLso-ZC1]